jgi:hypothetical protein
MRRHSQQLEVGYEALSRTRWAMIGVTLTPNASAVGGESVSSPTVERALFQSLAGG